MELGLIIAQVIVLALLGLLVRYLKRLPDAIHDRSIKRFELQLNKELEVHRAGITQELEVLRITQSQLQVQKTQEFTKLLEFYNEILSDSEKIQKRLDDKRQRLQLKRAFLDLGTKLFFFASDSTIERYIAFRDYTISMEGHHDPIMTMRLYGEFMSSIRRDLGHVDTNCTEQDFLRLILTDWDKIAPRPSGT